MKWPAVDPGELRHQITILSPQTFSDISGTASRMAPLLSAYAKIEAASGADLVRAGQITPQLALTVTMNWQPGVLAKMQVQAKNGTYVIEVVDNVLELDVTLKLICVALGDNQ